MARRAYYRRRELGSGQGSSAPPGDIDDMIFIDAGLLAPDDAIEAVHRKVSEIYSEYDGFADDDFIRKIVVFGLGEARDPILDPPRKNKYGNFQLRIGSRPTIEPKFAFHVVPGLVSSIHNLDYLDYYLDYVALFERDTPGRISLHFDFSDWTIRRMVGNLDKREDVPTVVSLAFENAKRNIKNDAPIRQTGQQMAKELHEIESDLEETMLIYKKLQNSRLG